MNVADSAAIFAATKLLEKLLEERGAEFPAGYQIDLSGHTISFTFPQGTIVSRELGDKGDGTILKTATQNLYGYPVWAMLVKKLQKFNQWKAIKEAIRGVLKEAIENKETIRQIVNEDRELKNVMDELQQNLGIPARIEKTPRRVTYPSLIKPVVN